MCLTANFNRDSQLISRADPALGLIRTHTRPARHKKIQKNEELKQGNGKLDKINSENSEVRVRGGLEVREGGTIALKVGSQRGVE